MKVRNRNRMSAFTKFKDFITNIYQLLMILQREMLNLYRTLLLNDEELRQDLLLEVEQKRKAGRPQGSGCKKGKN